jgi:hypothetical protein
MRRLGFLALSVALIGFGATVARAAAPSNDNFANAITIGAIPFTGNADVTEATLESGESQLPCCPISNTVWYRFTPASNVTLVGNLTGSDGTPVAGVYTGTSLASLTLVTGAEDKPAGVESKFSFAARAHKTYFMQLGVLGGTTPGVLQFSLQVAGAIEGTLRSSAGKLLSGACVEAFDLAHLEAGFVNTSGGGRYRIGGLTPGAYRVRFSDCSRNLDGPVWYQNATSFDSADSVDVPAGGKAPANGALPQGAGVAGMISDSGSDLPLEGCAAEAFAPSGELLSQGFSGSDGTYSIPALPAGGVKVYFECSNIAFPEWFDDRPDAASADIVATTAGSTTSGINAALDPATGTGSISGTVTTTLTEPVASACVDAYVAEGIIAASVNSLSDGTYRIDGLGSGPFRIRASDCGGSSGAVRWYDGKGSFADADPVTVVDGAETSSIDVVLDTSV